MDKGGSSKEWCPVKLIISCRARATNMPRECDGRAIISRAKCVRNKCDVARAKGMRFTSDKIQEINCVFVVQSISINRSIIPLVTF